MANPATITLWNELLELLRAQAPAAFRAWFYDLSAAGPEHGVLTIHPANPQQASYLRANATRFAAAAQAATGRIITVQIGEPESIRIGPPQPEGGDYQLDPNFTLSSFVVGPENQLAAGALRSIHEQPEGERFPLLIIGPTESGKTHLLQAICQAAARGTWRYYPADRFVAACIEAAERDGTAEFQEEAGSASILAIDGIEGLANRERSQEAVFHIFERVRSAGGQIVLSAREHPEQVSGLAPRLVSRFTAGLVVHLDPPCCETRVQIVHNLARRRSIELAQPVADRLSSESAGPRELARRLDTLIAAGADLGRPLDDSLVNRVLADHSTAEPIEILRCVSRRLGHGTADLTKRKQPRAVRFARQVGMHLVRRHSGLSLEETARLFETTVADFLESARQVEAEAAGDPKLLSLLDEIAWDAKNAGLETPNSCI